MKTPFIIYGLPRSKTFWLSRYLSYDAWECGHDELRHVRSMEDIRAWFSQPNIGTIETAGAPWWRLVQKMRPDVRVVTVRRPVEEVSASLMRLGLPIDREQSMRYLRHLDRKLDQIEARVPGVLSVSFAGLSSEESCAALFEHCLPYQHDTRWWQLMSPINLQTNLGVTLRYYRAYASQLEKVAKIARQQTIAGMRRGVPLSDGMIIQEESFETFFRDGRKLFEEHLVQVGEAPDNYLHKNLPLMRKMAAQGSLQVVTARSNGRMFGYLMTTLGPSLEEEGLLSAIQGTTFASKDTPGLGMKMERVSVDLLRSKKAGEVFFRAGVRGDGPRSGVMYERLGAEDYGRVYRLDLRVG